MKQNIVKFLRTLSPFLITIALWRLSNPILNPAGILAMIPIFYCSFIRPVPYFTAFAILFCLLIDYNFGTVLFWTALYSAYYAIMNIQTVIDLSHTKKYGIYAFMLFFGIASVFLVLSDLNLNGLFYGFLMYTVTTVVYIPICFLTKVAGND